VSNILKAFSEFILIVNNESNVPLLVFGTSRDLLEEKNCTIVLGATTHKKAYCRLFSGFTGKVVRAHSYVLNLIYLCTRELTHATKYEGLWLKILKSERAYWCFCIEVGFSHKHCCFFELADDL